MALGFEPLLQQLVAFSAREVAIDGAIASIRTPTVYNEPVVGNLRAASLSLNAQIGAFGGANGTIIPPECASGNCTWPEYNTLALCTVCKDLTMDVKVDKPFELDVNALLADFEQGKQSDYSQEWHPTYVFPKGNNLTVDISFTMINSSGTYTMTQWAVVYPRRRVWPLNISPELDSSWSQTWTNETYAGHPSPLFAMGYLDLNFTQDYSTLRIQRATECAFSPCVRTVNTQALNGIVSSNITNTDYGAVFFDQPKPDGNYITGGWKARVNATDFEIVDVGPPNTDAFASNRDGRAALLIQALRITLEGNTTYSTEGYHCPSGECDSIPYDSTGYTQTRGPWSSAGQQAIDGSDNFSQVVDGVGQALTGRFQQLATASVSGTATRNYVVMEVRWIWVMYPLALLVLSLVSLVATILATHVRHMAVWKESTLPLLYRYTGDGLGALTTATTLPPVPSVKALSNKVSQIVDDAREQLVRLRRHHAIWTLDSEHSQHPDKTKQDNDGGEASVTPELKSKPQAQAQAQPGNPDPDPAVIAVVVDSQHGLEQLDRHETQPAQGVAT